MNKVELVIQQVKEVIMVSIPRAPGGEMQFLIRAVGVIIPMKVPIDQIQCLGILK
jgi:hypothetical protein